MIFIVFLFSGCAMEAGRNKLFHSVTVNPGLLAAPPAGKPGNSMPGKQLSPDFDNSERIEEYKSAYRQTSNTETRCELLIAIGALENNDPDFFLMALTDKEPRIRQETAIQLQTMMDFPAVQQAMIKALDDPDDGVLLEVIEAVSILDNAAVHKKLNEIANNHPDALIRHVAADYAKAF